MIFQNYFQISKMKKNGTAQKLEQKNIKVLLDAP